MRIFTIGHSTHSLEELVALLRAHGAAQVADVRTVPRSRHNPQFNREALEQALPPRGIAYRHFPGLGSLRQPWPEGSPNTGWRNASFRGYADYMQTASFAEALAALVAYATAAPTAVMCAEAVPWRCHRSLIADALSVRGVEVCHILSTAPCSPHRLTRFARLEGGSLTYPAP